MRKVNYWRCALEKMYLVPDSPHLLPAYHEVKSFGPSVCDALTGRSTGSETQGR